MTQFCGGAASYDICSTLLTASQECSFPAHRKFCVGFFVLIPTCTQHLFTEILFFLYHKIKILFHLRGRLSRGHERAPTKASTLLGYQC